MSVRTNTRSLTHFSGPVPLRKGEMNTRKRREHRLTQMFGAVLVGKVQPPHEWQRNIFVESHESRERRMMEDVMQKAMGAVMEMVPPEHLPRA